MKQCRVSLQHKITSNLRSNLAILIGITANATLEQRQAVERKAEKVTKENIDVACGIVHKIAMTQSGNFIKNKPKEVSF